MNQRQRHSVLIALVFVHLIFDLAALPIAEPLPDTVGQYVGPLMIGAVLGQIAMLAAYLAWGSGHWLARWFTYWFLAVLVWYTLAVGAASTGSSFPVDSIERLLAICAAIMFLSVPIPYWAIRAFSRRRIELSGSKPRSPTWAKQQFSLRRLLVWTSAASVLLAICRSAAGREIWSPWSFNGGDFLAFLSGMLMFALLCVLLAIPATCASLGDRNPTRPLVIVGACAVGLVAIEWAVVIAITGDDHHVILTGLNLGILVDVVVCCLLVRVCGYRFTRRLGA